MEASKKIVKKSQKVELLTEIRDELKAMRLENAVKGAPKLWNKAQLAAYFDLAERTVDQVAARPNFPAPVPITIGPKGNRWLVEDIVEWVRRNASSMPKGRKD